MSSRGEGPSNRKDKTIDPREWGNVDFSRENLDIDTQIAALKSFKAQLKAQKRSQKRKSQQRERSRSLNKNNPRTNNESITDYGSSKGSKRYPRPVETQPVAQIAPRSYLGAALKNVGRPQKSKRTPTPPFWS